MARLDYEKNQNEDGFILNQFLHVSTNKFESIALRCFDSSHNDSSQHESIESYNLGPFYTARAIG